MMMNSDLPYRPCSGIMLLNKSNKVFVAQRLDKTSEAWQMPQGGIDEGEKPREAAIRELKEEIGTDNITILAEAENWLSYDLPDDLIPRLWGGKFRGQKQKWFLARFDGNDSEINLETKHPEFSEWRWVNPEEVPEIIVKFKQDLYKKLLTEFAEYL